jgi:alkaline phosphatase D
MKEFNTKNEMKHQRLQTGRTLLLVLILSGFLFGCNSRETKSTEKQPYLIVLSMDGFRWDYAGKTDTPNLDQIARRGVKAEAMVPSFPTKTFPNHYTMATGLYPDHHGIVLNTFYDPATDRYYRISDRKAVGDGSFYGGEPIWVTAEKQGVMSASLFWVGSEAEIKGVRPSIWKLYDHHMPYGDRIDTVISWLQRPEPQRPHLIMWYFDQPDGQGHRTGPDSPEMVQMIGYLDSLLGVFINRLNELPIASQINFIVTSDHGMENISGERVVMLNDYLPGKWMDTILGSNPVWIIKAKEGYKDQLAQKLAEIPHISAWPTGHLPERLHYGHNPRTLDFVVAADSSWSVFYGKKGKYFGGTHGYDNANKDMFTIFYGMGPAFKSGYRQPVFPNVSLYPLMCDILHLKAAPSDGNTKDVNGMLVR